MRPWVLGCFILAACGDTPCERFIAAQADCASDLGDPKPSNEARDEELDTCEERYDELDDDEQDDFQDYVDCFEGIDCSDESAATEAYFDCREATPLE